MTQSRDLHPAAETASKPRWTPRPYVIHLNADPSCDIAAANAAGALVRTLPLAGLRDADALDARATEVFEFPMPPGGISSMASWLTDLEWLDVDAGVLVLVDAAGAEPKVARAMLDMLPFVIAWWQLWPQQTIAHVFNVDDVDAAMSWMERENDRIEGRPMATGAPPAARIPVLIGE